MLVGGYSFLEGREKILRKYSRLKIPRDMLDTHCAPLAGGGINPAYLFGSIVIMLYFEGDEEFATLLDFKDYMTIRDSDWAGFNKYIVQARHHGTYLHRLLCDGIRPGLVAHHLGCRFDNRRCMLEAVTPAEHGQEILCGQKNEST